MATMSLTAAATAAADMLAVLDSGEALSTQQYADALLLGNNLLDNWSSDPKMVTSLARGTWNLGVGQQQYASTLLSATRPVAIVSASFQNSSGPGGPVQVVDAGKWAAIPDRQRQSGIIEALFYDRAYPSGFVYISPVPQFFTLSMEALIWMPLSQFPDTTTPITMLPGYARLIVSALAIEMAPSFDVEPTATARSNYQQAMETIEELNAALFGTMTDAQKQAILQASGK